MDKKRKIKVIKTVRKTDFLKNTRKRTLLKLKNKDEGVLGLIADSRIYSNSYQSNNHLKFSFTSIKHKDFFKKFNEKILSLNDFEFNVARKFLYKSIKNNDNSYLILSSLFFSQNSKSVNLIKYIHNNLIYRDEKDICKMKLDLLEYVLNSKPNDLLSDSLVNHLNSSKYRIKMDNQFVFYN
jgi:hypothetical protein